MDSNRIGLTVHSAQLPQAWHYANPVGMLKSLWGRRDLIWQFTIRDIQSRYRGSYLGIVWSLITPLVTLLVYGTVFSLIFTSRWPGAVQGGFLDFALILFCGMIVFNLFSECVSRAPSLIIQNPSYVKKVIFPLEILSVSILGSSLFNAFICLILLLLGVLLSTGKLYWTLIFLPLTFLPLVLFTLGASWLLASLGVFIRDIGNFVTVSLQLLFFITPIVYAASMVPVKLRFFLYLNPLTEIIEEFRRVILWGQIPDWLRWAVLLGCSAVMAVAGYVWFMKSKGAFADVV